MSALRAAPRSARDVRSRAGAKRTHASRLRDKPKWRSLPSRSTSIRGFRIRTILLASAFSMIASAALAQYGASGGFGPYTFNAPAAAAAGAAANAESDEDKRARCILQSHGRSGQEYLCPNQPSLAPTK